MISAHNGIRTLSICDEYFGAAPCKQSCHAAKMKKPRCKPKRALKEHPFGFWCLKLPLLPLPVVRNPSRFRNTVLPQNPPRYQPSCRQSRFAGSDEGRFGGRCGRGATGKAAVSGILKERFVPQLSGMPQEKPCCLLPQEKPCLTALSVLTVWAVMMYWVPAVFPIGASIVGSFRSQAKRLLRKYDGIGSELSAVFERA